MPISGSFSHFSPVRRATYTDVQKGYPLIVLLAATSVVTLASPLLFGPRPAITLLLFAQITSLVCFCSLFIRVEGSYLHWQFGPGWIRGRVALTDITTTNIVLSSFAYGWGFRRTPRGWRFHRQGALALEIRCRNGRRLRLGTTRAHELQSFLAGVSGRLPRS